MRPGAIAVLIMALFIALPLQAAEEVVLYTSMDRNHSEPVIRMFEEKTGIKVKAVYDTESTKTTGLVNRLIAEKENPQADVFWNNEVVRTIVLKNKGLLETYVSPAADEIPENFKDKEGFWTGFAARARILIVNTEKVTADKMPASIFDLTKPEWKGRSCMANPLFGTTSTHSAALFVYLGEEKAMKLFEDLKNNGMEIVAGNSTSKDRVAAGLLDAGFTDTDDANEALGDGKPVIMVFPDKEGMGTLLIPNTVCLIKKGPHQENAKKLMDFLLSKDVEAHLARSASVQIPVRKGIPGPKGIPELEKIKVMQVDFEKVAQELDGTMKKLEKLFSL